MNTRVRTSLKAMKAPSLNPDKKKKKMEVDRSKLHGSDKETASRRRSSRERKMALLQDVDKLKKKLRHEENVHKALERAFTRPLGALPRLPPYLPPHTLELLAEVAVLEVEVVRLEDQVVNFRQDLYQEAVYTSTRRTSFDSTVNLADNSSVRNSKQGLQISPNPKELNLPTSSGRNQPALCRSVSSRRLLPSNSFSDRTRQCSGRFTNVRADLTKILGSPSCLEDREGKENQSCVNSVKDKRSLDKTVSASVTPVKKSPIIKHQLVEKCVDPPKRQTECRVEDNETMQESSSASSSSSDDRIRDDTSPNKISENLVQCLSSLLIEMSTSKENGDTELWDPYSIYREFRRKDIGLQKHMSAIEVTSIDLNKTKNTLFLFQRLKVLLEKLAAVKLEDLTHQQKLAFWINAYNSCMMNAFVEHGTPKSPDIVVALMQKATINVGGHFLNAITIEHFILRLPFHLKYTCPKSAKTDDIKARTMSRLEWSEPLVTFALSCGSWSSPAVRVYTASEVKNELEAAKRDYLQAAIGVSSNNKLMIPKLLDWYLLDFAKDLESLIDWICLQLADELRSETMTCLAGRGREPTSKLIQLVPYDFRFRYILQR